MNKINESIKVKIVRIFLICTSWQSNKMIYKNKHELEHIVTPKKCKDDGNNKHMHDLRLNYFSFLLF